MPFLIANTQGKLVLKLEGGVTVRHVQDLAARLGETMGDGVAVIVDTGSLEDIDTCILQLLCSLQKAARSLTFENPSDAFLSAADRCGLRRELLSTREAR